MRQAGEIHQRTGTSSSVQPRVVVISHDLYRDATGMVFVCPIHPDTPGFDHPLMVRTLVAGEIGLIICDQVYRMPAAGLGEAPIGVVELETLERVRSQFRGIFS